ncbi:MAG: aldehyde dehydrogenase (NADP(+)) [Crocinitomicaceae bacterium]|nr:aldehyde dehydrogenase (NADP(+)) [Crocinitomicaceae bacterium]
MIFKSSIGFRFSKENNTVFRTFNCIQNTENEEGFCVATKDEVEQAAELAHQAFRAYQKTPPELRAQFLSAIGDELNTNREQLITQFCKEASLPESRAIIELNRTVFQLKNYGDYLLSPNWSRFIESRDAHQTLFIHSSLQAIGPVVVFGSSNFPFAYSTAGGDTASALAAGCPVIVKAHPMHAGTSCLVAECIVRVAQKLNLPDGVFSHLLDNGHAVGSQLVQHEYIKAVGFTGSIKGGRALMDLAAQRKSPIPVFAEMGSINPVVFFASELEKNTAFWVEKYAHSISNDAGQFCTKPGLIFVPNTPDSTFFIEQVKQALQQMDPKCHLHPNLFNSFKKQVEQSFDWIESGQPFHSQPVLRELKSIDFKKNEQFREEFFGPQSIVVKYQTIEELEKMLLLLDGQLTSTVIGSEEEFDKHESIIDLLKERAGRIIFNGVPTGVTVCDAMVHGGVYPSASDSRFTAVGSQSVYRFLRPIAVQKNK